MGCCQYIEVTMLQYGPIIHIHGMLTGNGSAAQMALSTVASIPSILQTSDHSFRTLIQSIDQDVKSLLLMPVNKVCSCISKGVLDELEMQIRKKENSCSLVVIL